MAGFVKPRYSELYTFHASSDGGMRLWVNNEIVVDNETSGTVQLEADKLYPITLEYSQRNESAFASLAWSSASQNWETIPTSRLFFADTSAAFAGTNLHEGLRSRRN